MTFLFKRKSGIYYFRKTYILPSGERQQVRKSLKTTDYKLAQFLALKLYFDIPSNRDVVGVISDMQTGELVATVTRPQPSRSQPKVTKLTLTEAISGFLLEKRRTGYWTDREYRRGSKMLDALGELLGASEVTSIGRKQAASFKDELLKTSKSVTTINNYLKRAAMLFDWLDQRGEVSGNPFRNIGVKQRRSVTLTFVHSVSVRAVFHLQNRVLCIKNTPGFLKVCHSNPSCYIDLS